MDKILKVFILPNSLSPYYDVSVSADVSPRYEYLTRIFPLLKDTMDIAFSVGRSVSILLLLKMWRG